MTAIVSSGCLHRQQYQMLDSQQATLPNMLALRCQMVGSCATAHFGIASAMRACSVSLVPSMAQAMAARPLPCPTFQQPTCNLGTRLSSDDCPRLPERAL